MRGGSGGHAAAAAAARQRHYHYCCRHCHGCRHTIAAAATPPRHAATPAGHAIITITPLLAASAPGVDIYIIIFFTIWLLLRCRRYYVIANIIYATVYAMLIWWRWYYYYYAAALLPFYAFSLLPWAGTCHPPGRCKCADIFVARRIDTPLHTLADTPPTIEAGQARLSTGHTPMALTLRRRRRHIFRHCFTITPLLSSLWLYCRWYFHVVLPSATPLIHTFIDDYAYYVQPWSAFETGLRLLRSLLLLPAALPPRRHLRCRYHAT